MAEDADVCSKVSEAVKIAGFLDKKGSMLWKKYWFVLEERLLLYYRSQLEYLNLSPCRGSVNMALVSSVQPRRNTREPVIHIVSRSNTLILKARDRETQTKWLQSLLESMGRGPSPFRLSLDNLPAQIHSFPRCRHTGSLDVVWKQPSTTGADASGTEGEEAELKTSDSRSSTLGRIRTVLTRRNTESDSRALPKRNRDSFLRKIMGKTKTKPERDKEDFECEDDPHYDTIRSNQNASTAVQGMLPGGTLTELKDRLASMEKKKMENPPELPPRISTGSLPLSSEDPDLSDESDFSGHYQKIRNVGNENKTTAGEEVDSDFSGHYQKIHDKSQSKNEEEEVVEKKVDVDINALYSLPKSKSSQALNSVELTEGLPIVSKEITEQQTNFVKVKSAVLTENLHDMKKEGIEQLIKELKEIETQRLKALEEAENSKSLVDISPKETMLNDVLVIEVRHEPERIDMEADDGNIMVLETGESCEELAEEVELTKEAHNGVTVEANVNKEEELEDEDETINRDRIQKLVQVEQGLTDLNVLLLRLTEITLKPLVAENTGIGEDIQNPVSISTQEDDEPDYDVPRPHNTIANRVSSDVDRLSATEFFSKADDDSSSFSSSSVEPDSLEAKKEVLDVCHEDLVMT